MENSAEIYPNFIFDGECQKEDVDPDIFFIPSGNENSVQRETRETEAKSYCNECAVSEQCLEWALRTNQREGIWGGLNEQERHPLHRERTRQNHPARVTLPTGGPRKRQKH